MADYFEDNLVQFPNSSSETKESTVEQRLARLEVRFERLRDMIANLDMKIDDLQNEVSPF